ncbi:MAG: RNA methyltransferase [Nitrospirae bacterium]|nr:RNA methyltransferase [Nitrospirota bacterium]
MLVEPRESSNVGASARAMKNMGFRNLCLVKSCELDEEAERLAHNALDVLDKARIYASLSDAVSDQSFVVAVARRTGKKRGMVLTLRQGVRRIYDLASENRVALLFGREDRGLYNEEVNECGLLLTIPANKEQPSLNLSHAVMVVAYELSMMQYSEAPVEVPVQSKRRRGDHINHGELAALFERMSSIMVLLDYMPRGDRNLKKQIMDNLKQFIGRAGLTSSEMKMLHGFCSQVERKLGTR